MPIKVGQRIGRLVVVEQASQSGARYRQWLTLCDCGNTKVVHHSNLGKNTFSCGCLHAESIQTHGFSKTRAYESWQGMRNRCLNPRCDSYVNYGGRGITICSRWDDFGRFFADMGERPDGLTLERLDVNGNYEPSNCCWATRAEQNRNKRPNLTCRRGHPINDSNSSVYHWKGISMRRCLVCARARERERYHRANA